MSSSWRRIRVDWEELQDAFADPDTEHRYYLDRETGAVHFFSAYLDNEEEEEDERELNTEDRYVLIPHARRVVPVNKLEEFVTGLDNANARRTLATALRMPGGPSKFNEVVENLPEAWPKWRAFSRADLESRIQDWLEEIGVEPL